jgi:hypothetical protein
MAGLLAVPLAGCSKSKESSAAGNQQTAVQDTNSAKPPKQDSHLGTWDWGWGEVPPGQEPSFQNTITLNADGAVSEPGGQTGKWERAGNVVAIRWGNGTTDTVTISEDGKKLEGKNNGGMSLRGKKK